MRVLDDRDLPAVLDLLDRDPVGNVFVTSRVEAAGLDSHRLGAQMWGEDSGGQLAAVCYAGANLVPFAEESAALDAFADHARSQGRRCSSIVGPSAMVARMWERLKPAWGPARDVRMRQPLMVTSEPPDVVPDGAVRRVRLDELDQLVPACIAMFTEEVGISPLGADGGAHYRARVRELVATGRSFARIENGRVMFKAEVGAVSRTSCQVQGVWVDPAWRGQGLAVAGMAAVVAACLHEIAPSVSLYVNDFNEVALRTYERVGFAQIGTFASILF